MFFPHRPQGNWARNSSLLASGGGGRVAYSEIVLLARLKSQTSTANPITKESIDMYRNVDNPKVMKRMPNRSMLTPMDKYWRQIPTKKMGLKYQGQTNCCQTECQNLKPF